MSEKEWAAMLAFIGLIGAGANVFTVFGLSFFYPVVVFLLCFGSCFDKEKTTFSCFIYGLGGSFISQSFYPIGYCAVIVVIFFLFSSVHRIAGGVFSFAAFVGATFLYEKTFSLWTTIMTGIIFLTVLIPEKVFVFGKMRDGYRGKFALRTIVNRDREEVRKKLSNVAEAFETVKDVLIEEESGILKKEEIAESVKNEFCKNCSREKTCDQRTTEELKSVVVAALDNGKASLLDVGLPLGDKCIRLPKLIATADDVVKKYRIISERKSGVLQGKEMVIAELSGTAELLKLIASDISTGFGFDTATENKIREELRYTDVIASDVAIYGNGKEGVTLTVRKKDADKKQLKTVLSCIMGEEMTEKRRKEIVGGLVSVEYGRAPAYGLLYGEASVSSESECGDSRQAVKLSQEKIMFILSDGMGTGKTAERTADNSVKLIKAFYLAGFDHKTVFSCVSKLLSLRKREDFSALDIVVADTSGADFDFIKQGGRESYLISKGNIETIEGCSLPLGIIEDTEPQIVHKKLKGGDIAVLISDGVADRLNYTDMTELFGSLRTINPQVIADEIIKAARLKPGKADDMTAIVIRVVKNR